LELDGHALDSPCGGAKAQRYGVVDDSGARRSGAMEIKYVRTNC
jgi:hypothetical protein